MGTLIQQGDQYIESEEPAKNNYGQNGYQGNSSRVPGDAKNKGESNFLPELKPTAGLVEDRFNDDGWQTRKISAEPYPSAHGMRSRSNVADPVKVPVNNSRPVKRR